MARAGDIPYAHSFACFISRRAFEQIVNAVAYPRQNVKLVGVMPGISSPDGASHQAIDDLAIMRATPNMTVIDLGESTEVAQAVRLAAEIDGPVYLRLRRGILPVFFDESKFTFEVGQSYLLRKGTDIGFVTSGLMTERALQAASLLEDVGVRTTVLHVPSIKPIDAQGVLEVAGTSRMLLTLDNHNVIGGLRSAVAEVLADHGVSVPFHRVGIPDVYGRAGTIPYLYRMFGFDPDQIAQTALQNLDGYSGVKVGSGGVEESEQAGWGGNWSES